MEISIVIPMYNEQDNVERTLQEVARAMRDRGSWELLVVDDGSTDRTLELVREEGSRNANIRLVSYQPNCGRGKALREGFAEAKGDVVVTLDADLSYDQEHIPKLLEALSEDGGADIVVGSPFMAGGAMRGVPFYRRLLSEFGNKLLGFSLPGSLHTVTGILRAYRRSVLGSLDLESDGKEIHLEILSKALALGYRVKEVPAVCLGRRKGKSKFDLSATATSHLLFSLFEKPMLLFGLLGVVLVMLGLLTGGYIIFLWQVGELNPSRPLMFLMLLLIVVGAIVLFFGFIATQIVTLRREIYRIQRQNLELARRIRDGA